MGGAAGYETKCTQREVRQVHVRLTFFLNQRANLLANVWRSIGPECSCSGGCAVFVKVRQDSHWIGLKWLGTQTMNYRIGF